MGRHTIICWRSDRKPLDWTGLTAVIVASGPSAKCAELGLIDGRPTIALNLSWQLVPWADVLYASDSQFWFYHRGVPEFRGRKFTSSPIAAQRFDLDQVLTAGNNSGLRAIHLAEALGSRRILLLGYDMHLTAGVHWHAPLGGNLRNPGGGEMRMWRDEMERLAPMLAKRGTKIINCSLGSALTCFPKMTLKEAFDGDDDHGRADQPRYQAVS